MTDCDVNNPLVLPPYSTDTFTVCRMHTTILTYFGRIAIFFKKNPGKAVFKKFYFLLDKNGNLFYCIICIVQ